MTSGPAPPGRQPGCVGPCASRIARLIRPRKSMPVLRQTLTLHRTVLARPRRSREIRLDLLRFRRMLLWLADAVEEELGVRGLDHDPTLLGSRIAVPDDYTPNLELLRLTIQ